MVPRAVCDSGTFSCQMAARSTRQFPASRDGRRSCNAIAATAQCPPGGPRLREQIEISGAWRTNSQSWSFLLLLPCQTGTVLGVCERSGSAVPAIGIDSQPALQPCPTLLVCAGGKVADWFSVSLLIVTRSQDWTTAPTLPVAAVRRMAE